ncbi:MAG: S41 family peptidase, partial [Bacteroidota bacterium]
MKNHILLVLTFLSIYSGYAQTGCLEDFQFVVNKIENDYPGYLDKTKNSQKAQIQALKASLIRRITRHPDSCAFLIDAYVSWFQDNHLSLLRNRNSRPLAGETPPEIRQVEEVDNIKSQPNSLEGIWRTFTGEIGIRKIGEGKYEALSLSLNGRQKGQVLYQISRNQAGKWEAVMGDRVRPIYLAGENRILEIHQDRYFVKASGDDFQDKILLYSYLPQNPAGLNTFPLALALSDQTFYLRVPSFANNTAEMLYTKHQAAILSRPNLIIDVRNNGGGQDEYYQVFSDLMYTQPFEI